jgi:hypothetical protein
MHIGLNYINHRSVYFDVKDIQKNSFLKKRQIYGR